MARMELSGFPHAPDGQTWCAVCAALAKGSALIPQVEKIEAGLADEGRKVFTVSADPRKLFAGGLELAVTWGPAPPLGAPLAPLCWKHAPVLDGDAPGPGSQQQQGQGLILPPGQDHRRRGLS